MSNIWDSFLINPLLNLLFLFDGLFGSLGFSIVAVSVFLRLILFPLSLPLITTMKKQKDLAPKMAELQKKYKNDRQKLAATQMELFQKEGVNPFSGCLPMILQIVVLISFYQVLRKVLFAPELSDLNNRFYFSFLAQNVLPDNSFFYLNLAQKDKIFLLPIIAAILQFGESVFRQRGSFATNLKGLYNAFKSKGEQMGTMQMQGALTVIYLPFLTLLMGATLPSGLMLYWATSVGFSLLSLFTLEKWLTKSKT